MTKRQLVIMWIAIALLVATWIYPPWVSSTYGSWRGKRWFTYWAPIWDERGGLLSYQRVFLEDAIIAALAVGLIISFQKRE